MYRTLAVLLLALSLWPIPAAAGFGAPARPAQAIIEALDAGHSPGALRPTTGLELLAGIDAASRGGPVRTCAVGPDHLPPAAARARGDDAPGTTLRAAAVAPVRALCERLPYHATAPPSSR
jgi:hypothetical protein